MKPEPDWTTVNQFVADHRDGGAGLQEIADVFGCSHQRIQAVLARAMKKIYRQLSQRNLWHLDDVI